MGLRGPRAAVVAKGKAPPPSEQWEPDWRLAGLSRADAMVEFIQSLKVTSGKMAGENFRLRPWQERRVRKWYDVDADGRRYIRTAFLTMPRKNGKTGLVAPVALGHLVGPETEPRGQVYSAAADRDQAAIIFNEMVAMIEADANLLAMVNIQRFKKTIENLENGCIYQALSSDARKAHGLGASFAAYDELAQARGRDLFDNLETSVGARDEPLFIVISTKSADPESVMSELTAYAEKIIAGDIVDPTFDATIYAAPDDPETDIWDEKVWHDCNPALGDFRSLEEMRSKAERAKRIPAQEASFRNLYLNQAINNHASFLSSTEWRNNADKPHPPAGRPAYAGLDLAERNDLTAFVIVVPDDDGSADVFPYFWLPGDGLQDKADQDRAPYVDWADRGFLNTTPGRSIRYRHVVPTVVELCQQFNIKKICFDNARMVQFQAELDDLSVTLPLEPHWQGFISMAPAADRLESMILNGALRHGGHPVLQWNAASSVVVMDPAGNRKFDKKKSTGRIDGIVALAMALTAASKGDSEPDIEAAILARGGMA